MDQQVDISELKSQGKYLEALQQLETSLIHVQDSQGPKSTQAQAIESQIVSLCNQLAKLYLQNNALFQAYELLKKAESLAESYPSVKVDTYNTLACYFRRINYTKEALEYLYKAIEIRPSVDTHLNLCAVLSQAGKHELALEQAMHTIVKLTENILEHVDKKIMEQQVPTLSIAYHNIAVELEHLNRLPASLEYYKKSVNLAEQFLDADHSITRLVTNARTKALLNSQNGHFKRKVVRKTPTKNTGRLIFKETGRSTSPYLKHYGNSYIQKRRAQIAQFIDSKKQHGSQTQKAFSKRRSRREAGGETERKQLDSFMEGEDIFDQIQLQQGLQQQKNRSIVISDGLTIMPWKKQLSENKLYYITIQPKYKDSNGQLEVLKEFQSQEEELVGEISQGNGESQEEKQFSNEEQESLNLIESSHSQEIIQQKDESSKSDQQDIEESKQILDDQSYDIISDQITTNNSNDIPVDQLEGIDQLNDVSKSQVESHVEKVIANNQSLPNFKPPKQQSRNKSIGDTPLSYI